MPNIYVVDVEATIVLNGTAKILDTEGQIIRSMVFDDFPVEKVKAQDALVIAEDYECGIVLNIRNVFSG